MVFSAAHSRDCSKLHKDPKTEKQREQVYFLLKAFCKAEAIILTNGHIRGLDALWKARRSGNVEPNISLGRPESAGLQPRDAALL